MVPLKTLASDLHTTVARHLFNEACNIAHGGVRNLAARGVVFQQQRQPGTSPPGSLRGRYTSYDFRPQTFHKFFRDWIDVVVTLRFETALGQFKLEFYAGTT